MIQVAERYEYNTECATRTSQKAWSIVATNLTVNRLIYTT